MKRPSAFLTALGAVLLLLPASYAAAQVTESIDIEAPEQSLNIALCQEGTFTFVVTFGNTTQSQYDPSGAPYEVWLGRGGGCSATDDDPDTLTKVSCLGAEGDCCEPLRENGSVTISSTEYVKQVTLGPYTLGDYLDCSSEEESSFELVVFAQPGYEKDSLTYEYLPSDLWKRKSLSVEYDLARPEPPLVSELEPGETSVAVTWVPLDDDTTSYRVYAAASPFDSTLSVGDQEGSLSDLHSSRRSDAGASSATVSDLRARTQYYITVVSIDDAENESMPTEGQTVETVEVLDFYEYYRQSAGGGEDGGYCAVSPGQAPGGALALGAVLLGLGLLVLRRPRGRRPGRGVGRWIGGAALGLVLLLPGVAGAESPRSMTLAIGFGSYLPQIDSESRFTEGIGPYERYFGEKGVFLTRASLGWHLINTVGVLSLDLGAGIGSVSADGFVAGTEQRAPEETSIRLLPLSVSLSYALDVFAEPLSFPLVPYVGGGADYVFWWMYNGAGDVATTSDPKGEGKGGTWGYHGTVGLRLLLDVLAPDMAHAFDLDMGVNNSYLFAELLVTRIDRFGERNSLNLSAESFSFGIAFDF